MIVFKSYFRTLRISIGCLAMWFFLGPVIASAQTTLTGDQSVAVGEYRNYTFHYTGQASVTWDSSLGTVVDTWQTNASTYIAMIYFDQGAGNYTLKVKLNGVVEKTLAITITSAPPPTPDPTISVTYNCGVTTINHGHNFSPAWYIHSWWWQTSSGGQDVLAPNSLDKILFQVV
jgi:hypothetical protein